MTRISLEHVQVGDHLAIRHKSISSHATHRLLKVKRLTVEQVVCVDAANPARELRFLKRTGKQVGEQYRYAEIATPELIAGIEHQAELARRRRIALGAAAEINSRAVYGLSLLQLEALAKAWQEIKAMGRASGAPL